MAISSNKKSNNHCAFNTTVYLNIYAKINTFHCTTRPETVLIYNKKQVQLLHKDLPIQFPLVFLNELI